MTDTTQEAPLADGPAGKAPAAQGWFIVNVAEAQCIGAVGMGRGVVFEDFRGENRFPELGVNVRVLEPGEAASKYHQENAQENFLVLHGECTAIVDDEERTMRTGDFLHLPPDVPHVLVGGGSGPCVILMTGARTSPREVVYPVSEVAARYGAAVAEETSDPSVAYAGLERRWGPLGEIPWVG